MSLTAFLQKVVEILDEAGVQYMLTGSLAAAYYAVPRATQDIDLVLETEAEWDTACAQVGRSRGGTDSD